MASARQLTLAQLQRLNGPKDSTHQTHLYSSTSPLLSADPSPVSHHGLGGIPAPLSLCNTQVGAPSTLVPSGLVEAATKCGSVCHLWTVCAPSCFVGCKVPSRTAFESFYSHEAIGSADQFLTLTLTFIHLETNPKCLMF